MLGGQKEGRTQVKPLVEKWKGCVSTNVTRKGLNERHSKNLMPKSKLMPLGGEGVKEETKKLGGGT